jgi:nucleoside-diphosphate-sugar epimerase
MSVPRAPAAAVLVTGATGSLGRPLLAALLGRGIERIYAMTHVEPLQGCAGPIRSSEGDVRAGPDLGLQPCVAEEIRSTITGIVHAAADTRFAAPLDVARAVNSQGTRHVLEFASRCPKLDRLVALSTTHVAGRRSGAIAEDDLEHDCGFVNAYEASKFEAEREVRARFADLPAAVCRLSTVVGDSVTGAVGRRSAVHEAVLLMYAGLAAMIPGDEQSPVDLIARDYASEAVAWMATGGFEPRRTWHVSAGDDIITAGELLDLTLACFSVYRPAWRKRAIPRPALVDLPTFELFRRSVELLGEETLRRSTDAVAYFAPQLAFPKRFETRRADTALARGAIVRPPIRDTWWRVVRRLIQPEATDLPRRGATSGSLV